VPELIQGAATPQALSAATLQWLDARTHQREKITALEQRFTALHQSLQRDTPRLAADAIQTILAA
jgi:Lipid A disaccharide synthetase